VKKIAFVGRGLNPERSRPHNTCPHILALINSPTKPSEFALASGADPENKLGGGQFRVGGLGDEVPQKLTTSQLKGYLDVLWRHFV